MAKMSIPWVIEKTVKKGEYLYAVVKQHPNSNKHGYVLHHRVVMENSILRILERNEIVHHKNKNKHDNKIENLELMTKSNHAKFHGLDNGSKWVELKCPFCLENFHRKKSQTHLSKKSDLTFCSRRCRGIFYREIQLGSRKKLRFKNVIKIYIRKTLSA